MEESRIVIDFTILLGAALIGGMVAHRLKQPVLLGYLLVGAAIGPHALGLVSNLPLVEGAATIGVALLMLTLGLEVSFAQLKQVGMVGLWGGLAQMLITFIAGAIVGMLLFNWTLTQSILLGLIISLSSTAVCLKILMDRGELDSLHGRIMIAILILQDIAVVLMMVIMPILSGVEQNLPLSLATIFAKAALFIGIGIALGVWVLPLLMGRVGGVRSRELFLLTILVLSLGAAVSTQFFGLSAVFGAFLIGLVLRETRFVHQALAEITPLRDIFAALFFVSLGMLLDPMFVVENWWLVTLTVAIIIFIKFLTIFGIVRFFGYGTGLGIMVGGGLFQIGEFSFIVAKDGVNSGILPADSYSQLIAGAIVTMLLTPVSITLTSRLYGRLLTRGEQGKIALRRGVRLPDSTEIRINNPVVLAGFGRVGQNIAKGLQEAGMPYSVIEIDPEVIFNLRCVGETCLYGDASNIHVLSRANLSRAKVLVVTFPDALSVLTTVKTALAVNPVLKIVARVHREQEAKLLKEMGVEELINPEFEASLKFLERVLAVSGWAETKARKALDTIREDEKIVEFPPGQAE